jgi:hypothetical protein
MPHSFFVYGNLCHPSPVVLDGIKFGILFIFLKFIFIILAVVKSKNDMIRDFAYSILFCDSVYFLLMPFYKDVIHIYFCNIPAIGFYKIINVNIYINFLFWTLVLIALLIRAKPDFKKLILSYLLSIFSVLSFLFIYYK